MKPPKKCDCHPQDPCDCGKPTSCYWCGFSRMDNIMKDIRRLQFAGMPYYIKELNAEFMELFSSLKYCEEDFCAQHQGTGVTNESTTKG
jgi:hypothetical protein